MDELLDASEINRLNNLFITLDTIQNSAPIYIGGRYYYLKNNNDNNED